MEIENERGIIINSINNILHITSEFCDNDKECILNGNELSFENIRKSIFSLYPDSPKEFILKVRDSSLN